jgi:hypothetical protein
MLKTLPPHVLFVGPAIAWVTARRAPAGVPLKMDLKPIS